MRTFSGTWARVLGISLLAAMLFPVAAHAAVDAFLWIDGVKGGSMDDKHKDWIEIQSFDMGTSSALQERAMAERAGRPVKHQPLVITREMDVASPKLRAFCATGKHFPAMNLDVVSGGRTLHYHLTGVTVNSYIVRKPGGSNLEEISFSYQKITMD